MAADVTFDPSGKPFQQRLAAFLEYAVNTYNVVITQDDGRTPEWAQQMHVCHMFLYNAFKVSRPKHVDKVNNRTISWEHLSDPKTEWTLIKASDCLRTADGKVPEKLGMAWKPGSEPDRKKTETRMSAILVEAGVANQGKAMVACGVKPCGEPCGCKTGASKHLSGLAADLNRAALGNLTAKLKADKAGTLDALMAKFGLHRPLLHHPTSPEDWHIEAIPASADHIPHSAPVPRHRSRIQHLELKDQLLPSPYAKTMRV